MNLKYLKNFIAVAEEMNVARAGRRLGIAQPTLSQQIQQLEQQIGVSLFYRDNQRLSLTNEGSLFLAQARITLKMADHAIQTVRNMRKDENKTLRLGYVDSVMLGEFLPASLRIFRHSYPNVKLTINAGNVCNNIRALADENVDLAILRGPIGTLSGDLHYEPLAQETLSVYLPAGHRLCAFNPIPAIALMEESFVTLIDPGGIGLAGQIAQICRDAGFTPRVSQQAGETSAVAGLVAAGFGISILPAQLKKLRIPNLSVREFDSHERSPIYLVTKAADRSPLVKSLTEICRSCAAAAQPQLVTAINFIKKVS